MINTQHTAELDTALNAVDLLNRSTAAKALWTIYHEANRTDGDHYAGEYPGDAASSVCRPLEDAMRAMGVSLEASIRDGELYIYTHEVEIDGRWERLAPTGRSFWDEDDNLREIVLHEAADGSVGDLWLVSGWEAGYSYRELGKEKEADLVDIQPGDAAPFEQYLLVTEAATGRRTAMKIIYDEPLDLERVIKRFVAAAFGGELTVANIFPNSQDDWHAAIITDWRNPDSVVVWDSASFCLEGGDNV